MQIQTDTTLIFTNDLTRSTNARDICGFTDVIIVVLNTKFRLVCFCSLIESIYNSRSQESQVKCTADEIIIIVKHAGEFESNTVEYSSGEV